MDPAVDDPRTSSPRPAALRCTARRFGSRNRLPSKWKFENIVYQSLSTMTTINFEILSSYWVKSTADDVTVRLYHSPRPVRDYSKIRSTNCCRRWGDGDNKF